MKGYKSKIIGLMTIALLIPAIYLISNDETTAVSATHETTSADTINTIPPGGTQISSKESDSTVISKDEEIPNSTQATSETLSSSTSESVEPSEVSETSEQVQPSENSDHTVIDELEQTQSNSVADTIIINGKTIPLVNSQNSDAAPYGDQAGIWNGNGLVDDNAPSHIIGHNPGAFSNVMNLNIGDTIQVCDSNQNIRDYIVYSILEVNDDAYDHDGNEQWDSIINQPGESISLQTCINDNWNSMVLAK